MNNKEKQIIARRLSNFVYLQDRKERIEEYRLFIEKLLKGCFDSDK